MSTIENSLSHRPARRAVGPRTFLALLLAAAAWCGCARYDMTLTNGQMMSNVRKPVRSQDGTYYTIKFADGKAYTIPASRVINIAPHGDTNWMFRNQ
jgi:hypothetical protein